LGIGFATFVMGYIVDIRPLQHKLCVVRERKAQAEQALKNKKQSDTIVEKENQPAKKEQQQHNLELNRFAGKTDVVDVLRDLERAATNFHVELQLFEPQAEKEEEGLVKLPMKIEVCGGYQNLIGFLNGVFDLSCFFLFEEILLQEKANSDGKDEVVLQAVLSVYKSKESLDNISLEGPVVAKNIAISLPSRDIFTEAPGKRELFLWASKELSFLGVMKKNGSIYGFVGDPAGRVHQVAIGDRIGLKQSRIEAINERGIIAADKAESVLRRVSKQ